MRTGRRDWLWAIAAITIVGVAIVGGIVILSGGSGGTVKAIVSGVECERGERLEYHVHSHLTLIVEGEEVPVTGNIGIRTDCIFWLHTHSTNGLLHVEAPEQQPFTLGQFFAVWDQPLSASQLLDNPASAKHEVQATVNGEPWSGDPANIPLEDLTSIVLEYGPPFVPPPEFDWGQ